ncbi:hypothetical protein AVEN_78607-1 [Araneus ventricosus]|uniref:Uncharacterized protein n=1 Tax=Araneus ventricosus TaxID=182803 RepID=A0A4Y2G1C0_ARAVE|nr:hypothetical protein AVEN_78607-1 [Araneus ventricosus]
MPTIIVKPVVETIASSAILKAMLEDKISPRNLGVKILNCQPANGKGVIIRTETIEMAKKLEIEINTHLELKNLCSAREPRKRSPQILIYDIAESAGDKSQEEADFIEKLKTSNTFPEGDIRVLFRRKGKGSY